MGEIALAQPGKLCRAAHAELLRGMLLHIANDHLNLRPERAHLLLAHALPDRLGKALAHGAQPVRSLDQVGQCVAVLIRPRSNRGIDAFDGKEHVQQIHPQLVQRIPAALAHLGERRFAHGGKTLRIMPSQRRIQRPHVDGRCRGVRLRARMVAVDSSMVEQIPIGKRLLVLQVCLRQRLQPRVALADDGRHRLIEVSLDIFLCSGVGALQAAKCLHVLLLPNHQRAIRLEGAHNRLLSEHLLQDALNLRNGALRQALMSIPLAQLIVIDSHRDQPERPLPAHGGKHPREAPACLLRRDVPRDRPAHHAGPHGAPAALPDRLRLSCLPFNLGQNPAQLLRRNLQLEDVVQRATAHRLPDVFKVVVAAQHDELHRGILAHAGAHQLEAVHAIHLQIGENEIRLEQTDLFQRFLAVLRVADHGKAAALPVQDRAEAHAHQQLIVHDQHSFHGLPPQSM